MSIEDDWVLAEMEKIAREAGSKDIRDVAAPECAIESAAYANGAPMLFCACGFATGKHAESWEEAGEDMDAHLDTDAPDGASER